MSFSHRSYILTALIPDVHDALKPDAEVESSSPALRNRMVNGTEDVPF